MRNDTILNGFFLSGLSGLLSLQLPLFFLFLLIFLLTLIWNLMIISLIVSDSHLQTPMYFFLGNLATMDLCCSSVIVPRMLFDLLTQNKRISMTACMTQVFFFIFFATSEVLLLAVMSYDRFSAVCQPLHYTQVMSFKMCERLASIVWCLGFTNSSIHTLCALKLTFCKLDIIESFFCDLPQLFQISCSNVYVNILLIFILGVFLGGGSLILTFLPYVSIFITVLKMKRKGKMSKALSTCTSHVMVVFIFYCSIMFNYFQPSPNYHSAGDKIAPVFYTVIVPVLNPLIYSLRNQDFRRAFYNVLRKIVSSSVENSSHLNPHFKKCNLKNIEY